MSLTHQGTTSDGIGPRKHQHLPESQYRSNSKPYCKHFYAEAPIRKLHYYFIQLLFGAGRVDPEAISEKLKQRCCDGDHSDQCVETWTQIKDYLVSGMFTELKLEAYQEEEILFEVSWTGFDLDEEVDIGYFLSNH